eukprot:TRINITY_DN5037_c0_g4_i2.p1 TRINITY_DN5037_c0_g4~~TRINITY_DN5037_c0_g4_i2.p1  ORF type:complete len:391 (+),score=56.65 TRINITY_DN5037_c0_g4_i2:47-1219(+)
MATEYLHEISLIEARKLQMYLRFRLGTLLKLKNQQVTEQIKATIEEEIMLKKKVSVEEHNSPPKQLIMEDDKYPHLELMFGSYTSLRRHKPPLVKSAKQHITIKPLNIRISKKTLKGLELSSSTQCNQNYSERRAQWLHKNGLNSDTKLFIITGNYPDVRKALLNRGWTENTDASSPIFDFKWALRHAEIWYSSLQKTQVVNHYENVWELTTKTGLLHNLRNLVWTHSVDCDTFFPKAFDLSNNDCDNFIEEFKLSKAEAVLKEFVNNPKKINEIGRAKVILAVCITQRRINALKEMRLNKLLVSEEEWELLNSHGINGHKILSANKSLNTLITTFKYNSTLETAALTALKQLRSLFPQYSLTAHSNLWILKPSGLSRGRGIHVLAQLTS